LIRASTSLFRAPEGVDGRVKPGQDETWRLVFLWVGSRGEAAEGVYLDDHSYR
jgi:hypothetical protein